MRVGKVGVEEVGRRMEEEKMKPDENRPEQTGLFSGSLAALQDLCGKGSRGHRCAGGNGVGLLWVPVKLGKQVPVYMLRKGNLV